MKAQWLSGEAEEEEEEVQSNTVWTLNSRRWRFFCLGIGSSMDFCQEEMREKESENEENIRNVEESRSVK